MKNFYTLYTKLLLKIIPLSRKKNIFIIASDSHFFPHVSYVIESIKKNESGEIIFYDLGITKEQKNELEKNYQDVVYKFFNNELLPDHYKDLKTFAWKSNIVYNEVLQNPGAYIFYMDTRNRCEKSLNIPKKLARLFGIYTALSSNNNISLTHPATIDLLKIKKKSILNRKMIAAGFIAINTDSKYAVKTIEQWDTMSKDKNILIPEGSSRANHRQDQSILSLLLAKRNFNNLIPRNIWCGVSFHNEAK